MDEDERRALAATEGNSTAGQGIRAAAARPITDVPPRRRSYRRAMTRESVTARAARWSAAHRRAAILGWLAFVFVAFAIGSAAGMVPMRDQDYGIGDSRQAERTLVKEFPTAARRRAGAASRAAAARSTAPSSAPP